MKILSITTANSRIALQRRGKVPLSGARAGGVESLELLTVRVETSEEFTGFGFSTWVGPGTAAVGQLLESDIKPLLIGESASDTDRLFAKVRHHFRSIGFAGPPARTYAALDFALWDLKGKQAKQPLAKLLGNLRSSSPYFLSDTLGPVWDAGEVARAAKPAIKAGAMGVRVELGSGDVNADAEQVRELSEALGDDAWLGVSACERYDLNTALALAHFFEDQGVDWFEDPIPAGDFLGYSRLADRMEMPLALGANFDRVEDFHRVIRDGLARVIRPDPFRLGGITPLLKLAAVAEAYHVSMSPVRCAEVGVHLACGLAAVPHADYTGWLRDSFTGGPTVENGKLLPPATPGLGISIK